MIKGCCSGKQERSDVNPWTWEGPWTCVSWSPSKCLTTVPFYKRHWYHHQIPKERCNRRMSTRQSIRYLPAAKDTQDEVLKTPALGVWLLAVSSLFGDLSALNQTLRHQSLVYGGWWIGLQKRYCHWLPIPRLCCRSPFAWQRGLLNMCADGTVTMGLLPAEGMALLTCPDRALEEEMLWEDGDV